MPRARPRYALLLRGVNVGGHKRVPMADLRQLLEGLGYARVRTLLNSGNAVFDTARAMPATRLAAVIDSAIEARFGFTARAFVLTASDVDLVVAENTLPTPDNPSRSMVAFLAAAADREKLLPLTRQSWNVEAIVVGSRAVYVSCPAGILESPLFDAVGRALGAAVTTRNWATTLKLQALCRQA